MREHLDRTRAQLRDIVFGSDGDPAASADVEAPENASAR
jgi:hypothetical protein